jgi:hypothetical protein
VVAVGLELLLQVGQEHLVKDMLAVVVTTLVVDAELVEAAALVQLAQILVQMTPAPVVLEAQESVQLLQVNEFFMLVAVVEV